MNDINNLWGSEYLPYDVESQSQILLNMQRQLHYPANVIAGSFASAVLNPVAYILAITKDVWIYTIPYRCFINTAWSEWLDRLANDNGISRNPAVGSRGDLIFEGISGTLIPSGTKAIANNGLVFSTLSEVTIQSDGRAIVLAQCDIEGKETNLPAGAISELQTAIIGVSDVLNESPAVGGYDLESDLDLRQRLDDRVKRPPHSGNQSDYKQWAYSIPGTGNARVIPLARGNGTVDIVILGQDNTVPAPQLVEQIQAVVDNSKPIGADPLVRPAEIFTVDITADLYITTSATLSTIQNTIRDIMIQFFNQLIDNNRDIVLSYNKLLSLVFSVSGVIDIDNMLLNGARDNITLNNDQIPVIGTVSITGRV